MGRGRKLFESENAVIDPNPISLLNVKKLQRVIIPETFRISRREVALLALRHREKVIRLLVPRFHTKTLKYI
jgi:hypothetical protein